MKHKLGLVAIATLATAVSSANLTYHVTVLPLQYPAQEGANGVPISVNKYGEVLVRETSWPSRMSCFLYSSGNIISEFTYSYNLNSLGEVVGHSVDSWGFDRAGLYSTARMLDLGEGALGFNDSDAFDVNDGSAVIGYDQYGQFVYSNGNKTHFSYPGYWLTFINNSGTLAGTYKWGPSPLDTFTVVGASGSFTTIPNVEGATGSSPADLNNNGQVVGTCTGGSVPRRAFLYSNGVSIPISPEDSSLSVAYGINDAGQVVGLYGENLFFTTNAFLYHDGVFSELETMLEPGTFPYHFTGAYCISENGYIGVLSDNHYYNTHPLLLTPNAGFTGTLTLGGWVGDKSQVSAVVEVRVPGTTTVVQSQNVKLNASGSYTFITTLAGTYDISVKPSHWLRETVSNVTLTGDSFVTVDFSLYNGDVTGDNVVNIDDANAIASVWRTTPSSPNWNANADLNGDLTVNLADWNIMSSNYNRVGDP